MQEGSKLPLNHLIRETADFTDVVRVPHICYTRTRFPVMFRQPLTTSPRHRMFGPFVLDEASGELHKHGIRLRLQGQPLQILLTLIRQPGQVVTREEFQQQLWTGSTFVDFDHGLNTAMNRLRQMLGDSAEQPRYIETMPGRGYRFIALVQERAPKPVLVMAPAGTENEPAPPSAAIGDARVDSEGVVSSVPAKDASASVTSFRLTFFPWVAAAGALVIVAGLGWWIGWRSTWPADRPLLRLSVDLGPGTFADANLTAAISPDGTRLVFPVYRLDGTRQLATRLLDQPQATLLPGTGGAKDPFFKPDGQWIGFFAEGKMKKVSVRGSAVITLCDAPDGRGAAWGEDDSIIATLDSQTGIGLSRVQVEGGTPQALTNPAGNGEATHRWPQVLPGGQAVLFTGNMTAATYDESSIEVLSLKTGQVKVVQRGGYFGRYLPGGYLVYIHQGTVFGMPFDRDRLEVRGKPTPLVAGVAGNSATAGGQLDFSRNGIFVYLSGKPPTWSIAWMDRSGQTQPLLATSGLYYDPRLSPDGKRLAFSSGTNIEIYDSGRGTTTRLTNTAQAVNFSPVWTPDGKRVAFESQGISNFSLQWIRADGAGEAQRLLESKNRLMPYSISPDGKRLAYTEQNPQTGMDLWTLPLDTSDPANPKPGKPEPFLGTPFAERAPAFSPDGRWIAYSSTESGRSEVYVRPFPAAASSGRSMISAGGGHDPIWSRDARKLFYQDPANRIMSAVYTANGGAFAAERPVPWSSARVLETGDWNLDLAPDGKRFVVTAMPKADSAADAKGSVQVTFLINFFDEVRRRIPTAK